MGVSRYKEEIVRCAVGRWSTLMVSIQAKVQKQWGAMKNIGVL